MKYRKRRKLMEKEFKNIISLFYTSKLLAYNFIQRRNEKEDGIIEM